MLKSIPLLLALFAGCASAPPPTPAQPQPQPPPPAPTQAQAPAPAPEQPALAVKDIVQPVKIEKVDTQSADGEEGGVEGGVVGGDDMGPPPPPPPPEDVVSPKVLEGHRVAGNKWIQPDVKTRTAIARSGKTRVVASFKLCVDDTGAVARVVPLKSSGFPDYDALIRSTITATWQYSPYVVDGRPRPVCTAVTFIYDQH